METNSEPGCVHLSSSACGLLQAQAPYMRVVSRGRIPIKGKGDMETFCVGSAPFTLADPVLLKSQSFIGSKWRAI